MGKAKMVGHFKPCSPKSRYYGNGRKAPWQGGCKKNVNAAATDKKEAKG